MTPDMEENCRDLNAQYLELDTLVSGLKKREGSPQCRFVEGSFSVGLLK